MANGFEPWTPVYPYRMPQALRQQPAAPLKEPISPTRSRGSLIELNMIVASVTFIEAARSNGRPPAPSDVTHFRVRHDKIDKTGRVTLRYRSRLHHIGLGRRHAGTPVLLIVADRDIHVITTNGELIRHLTIDPTRNYQPITDTRCLRCPATSVSDVSRHHTVPPAGLEPAAYRLGDRDRSSRSSATVQRAGSRQRDRPPNDPASTSSAGVLHLVLHLAPPG